MVSRPALRWCFGHLDAIIDSRREGTVPSGSAFADTMGVDGGWLDLLYHV